MSGVIMYFYEAIIAAASLSAFFMAVRKPAKTSEFKQVHECSMHGHDYQPAYDERGSETAKTPFVLPSAGPFMDDRNVVKIAQAAAQAMASSPRQKTYVHSVCRYCGLTIKRES